MFSLPYYNAAHIELKASELFTRGDFITYCHNENKAIGLYSLDNFYVEVEVLSENPEIIDIRGITIDEALDNYYDLIRKQTK